MSEVIGAAELLAKLNEVEEALQQARMDALKVLAALPAVPSPAGPATRPKPAYNSKAVILTAPEICQRLKISQRTLYRRLATDWGDGHWFFQINGKWHIRESHLEELISLMENGQIKV